MRGAHPADAALFGVDALPELRQAAADYRDLLAKGYGQTASLKLVGDHFQLRKRQRQALFRAVSSRTEATRVRACLVASGDVRRRPVAIDGYNLLITCETAVAGGLLLQCDDGVIRDVAEKHGSYRSNENSPRALEVLATNLTALEPGPIWIFLDRPMSHSGELARTMRERFGGETRVEVVDSGDAAVRQALLDEPEAIAVTSDGPLLARCGRGFDLCQYAVRRSLPDAWIVDLTGC